MRSALHEVAHWCIAGDARRQQTDYGYWYESARDREAQRRFEQMEIRPQALEWIFCEAAGVGFRVSQDNFDAAAVEPTRFRKEVRDAAVDWLRRGLPDRAGTFIAALRSRADRPEITEDTFMDLPR